MEVSEQKDEYTIFRYVETSKEISQKHIQISENSDNRNINKNRKCQIKKKNQQKQLWEIIQKT